MPHRKNAKGDIGTAKKFSDSYDMDNIYLAEEGWVYRHFKNTERTLWWDEIIVAGQVKPGMEIHGVSNGVGVTQGSGRGSEEVILTNPLKLGTATTPSFQQGDGVFDYRYSDHVGVDPDDGLYGSDPNFDDDQSGTNNPAPNPNPPGSGGTSLNIGSITIVGPHIMNVGDTETFTFTINGGDFLVSEVSHTWTILDVNDTESGMTATAVNTVAPTAATALVRGDAQGYYALQLVVTADGAENSPVTETYVVQLI